MSRMFLLGLGVMKSGTTMVHRSLVGSKVLCTGGLKEYHIFDTKVGIREYFHQVKLGRNPLYIWRTVIGNIPYLYQLYFLILSRWTKAKWVGDLTPTYGELPKSVLDKQIARLRKFGFDVRCLLILREPVTRCFSMVRHIRRHGRMEFRGLNPSKSDLDVMIDVLKMPELERKSRYEKTCETAKHIAGAECLILINDTLQEQVETINRFLGISLKDDAFSERIFTSGEDYQIPDDYFEQAVNHYRETYDYCFEHFPETKRLWQRAYDILYDRGQNKTS